MNDNDLNLNGLAGAELFAVLLERHAAGLELYARQLCHCAEDVVQESLIELAAQVPRPRDVVAWLYRVVRNRALNAARSTRRRQHHETIAAQRRAAWLPHAAPEGWDTADLTTALEALPGEEREIIVAHVWGKLSFQQIGRLLDLSDSTAHRRYVTALKALRRRLGVPCPEKT